MSQGWTAREAKELKPARGVRKPIAVVNGSRTTGPAISDSFEDLDEADEEDLLLELRKIEIHQRLKKLRQVKGQQAKA